ncbi:MAG: AAA family ATPase [archaeon]|nr:MAG: AAA family ATPase [archaeon]
MTGGNKVVAVVGMPGCGKSEVVRCFEEAGFSRVYFGDVVFDRMKEEGLEINERNEQMTREKLRAEHGMGVVAKRSLPKIESFLEKGNVVVESMYSWEEYLILKEKYGESFKVVAVYSSPGTRYERLGTRNVRPLNPDDARSRDYTQLANINTGGPIVMADFTLVNEGSLEELRERTKAFIKTMTTE